MYNDNRYNFLGIMKQNMKETHIATTIKCKRIFEKKNPLVNEYSLSS